MEVIQLTACTRYISCRDFICLAGLRARLPGDDGVLAGLADQLVEPRVEVDETRDRVFQTRLATSSIPDRTARPRCAGPRAPPVRSRGFMGGVLQGSWGLGFMLSSALYGLWVANSALTE
jgi:hypothetical protein